MPERRPRGTPGAHRPHAAPGPSGAGRLLAALAVCAGATLAAGPPQGAPDRAAAEGFVAALHAANARDDRRAVAQMVRYPITVRVGSVRVPLRDAAALVEHYEVIFTRDVKAAIARAAGRGGSGPGLTAAGDGFVIGTGIVRIAPAGEGFRIVAMDLPEPGAAGGGGPAGGAGAAPRRVMLRAGARKAEMAGAIGAGGTDYYVVRVNKGRLLEVRIDGVKEQEVVARVLDDGGRAPVDARAGKGARRWAGRVPESADYRIEVSREGSGGPDVLTYTLVVSMR